MAFALSARDRPLADVNMTPLIDVMLVLLIMIMLSLPMQSHQVDYVLPQPGQTPDVPMDETRNRLIIDSADRIGWNGTIVSERDLALILRQDVAMTPEPVIEFAPDRAAGYAISAEVLRLVKASGVTNFGFVGNEKYREFGR